MTHREAGPLPPLPLSSKPLPPPPLPGASSAPARVEITYALMFEELREGLTQSPETIRRKSPSTTTKVLSLLGCMLLITLVAMVNLMLKQRGPLAGPPAAAAPPPAPPAPVEVAVAVFPSVLAALAVGGFMLIGFAVVWIANSKNERLRRASHRITAFSALALVLLALLGVVNLANMPEQVEWTVTRKDAILLSLLPWAVNVALFIVLSLWLSRAQLRRQWQSKPYLSRQRAILLDAAGERSSDEITDLLYRWPHFVRAWETEHVLVLQDENDLRHILPKRVMDRPTLDQARSVISNHVADCKFLTMPGGFPVATPAPPAA